ncbi:MAG: transcriptional regulator, partial [Actinomycetota bacterium]|nr:transcriptional regulator [Actinomycetota bacterium]
LAHGPRRFTDLVEGLPGVSRKLLSERLRELEQEGLVARKELPPPAARHVYELTVEGSDLAGAMAPLIAWGARRLDERRPEETFRPRWGGIAMISLADREATAGVKETYQYVIGSSAFHLVVDDGSIELHDGHDEAAAVVVTTDEKTWVDVLSGKRTVSSAVAAGALTITGDRQAAKRLGKIFSRDGIDRLLPAGTGRGMADR